MALATLMIEELVAQVLSDLPELAATNLSSKTVMDVFATSLSTLSKLLIQSFNLRSANLRSAVPKLCSLRLPEIFFIP